jgi:hypothetical protein
MGNCCPCLKSKRLCHDSDLGESFLSDGGENQRTVQDFDEWEINNLKNKDAKQIAVVDENDQMVSNRKINVEDFVFLKVSLIFLH